MISCIVTAFNEEDNIGPTLETIQAVVAKMALSEYEVIVVDDGSTDATYARVADLMTKTPNLRCVRHPINRGLGSAVRSGIEQAKYPRFMVIPGDNDVHRDFALSMLSFRDKADLILAAPVNKEVRTISRNVVSMLYQMLFMVSFGLFVNYINGPGIWPTEKAKQVGLRARRFAIISEMNVKLLRSGCSFLEVPGYFQAGPKSRSTVTLRNLSEVMVSYLALLYEIYIRSPKKFASRPRRVPVRLVNTP